MNLILLNELKDIKRHIFVVVKITKKLSKFFKCHFKLDSCYLS